MIGAMASGEAIGIHRKKRRKEDADTGPYILHPLIEDVPLSTEQDSEDVHITCLEVWNGNIYIGTSAGEILHFVSLPSDSQDPVTDPTFILASRLQPIYTPRNDGVPLPGIQNIVLLPRVNKACILCNGTVTFYSLPELSPVFGNAKVSKCSWVGGLDLNSEEGGDTVMVCVAKLIRLLTLGEDIEKIKRAKNIQFPGCLSSVRRDQITCIADGHSYALLDVEQQLKVPLFPISSIDEGAAPTSGQVEDISSDKDSSTSRNKAGQRPLSMGPIGSSGHTRGSSFGMLTNNIPKRSQSQDRLQTPDPFDRSGTQTPEQTSERQAPKPASTLKPSSADKPLPPPPSDGSQAPTTPVLKSKLGYGPLIPHVLSPTPTEFLLTTGTLESEPGVGIFVNLDGDVVRGSIEFASYPQSIIIDVTGEGAFSGQDPGASEKGFVLAIVKRERQGITKQALEIQRWDVDAAELPTGKAFLCLPPTVDDDGKAVWTDAAGLRSVVSKGEIRLAKMGDMVKMVCMRVGDLSKSMETTDSRTRSSLERVSGERELFEPSPIDDEEFANAESEETFDADWEAKRNKEEETFAQRLSNFESRVVVWSGNRAWWAVRNPLALKLDSALSLSEQTGDEVQDYVPLDRRKVVQVVNSIRGQEAKTETEFVSLGYIKQKAGLMLLADLLLQQPEAKLSDKDMKFISETLLDGAIDPRVVLFMVPQLKEEILDGGQGVWVHGGLVDTIEACQRFQRRLDLKLWKPGIMILLKQYFSAWRKKKGFASISDETNVFKTVDAALLHLLLHLDEISIQEGSSTFPFRAELYSLVDHGLDCFERAVDLLEEYERLYILSRLYQSRKMSRYVLATWKRIIEGEANQGGDKFEGENDVRRYLVNIRDATLVEEYGTWLANRNPKFGVLVFADDGSRVKLEPAKVVQLLKEKAPAAVKEYLEYLVFTRNNYRYTDDLVGYYLDTVISKLENSPEARSLLSTSYETYRALKPPKPTYRQFISENVITDDWWQNRIRLLQLLGSHDAGFSYDISSVLSRIAPFEKELVSETIILDGRQGHHQQALRLLTHGLGDYDTAIRYCLFGGSTIFRPDSPSAIPSRSEQTRLFSYLLREFLKISDVSEQLERTSVLLDRFSSFFDVAEVLELIPEDWSVELIQGFLVNSLRRLISEKNESMVAKALSGSENLQVNVKLIDEIERIGPKVEEVD